MDDHFFHFKRNPNHPDHVLLFFFSIILSFDHFWLYSKYRFRLTQIGPVGKHKIAALRHDHLHADRLQKCNHIITFARQLHRQRIEVAFGRLDATQFRLERNGYGFLWPGYKKIVDFDKFSREAELRRRQKATAAANIYYYKLASGPLTWIGVGHV